MKKTYLIGEVAQLTGCSAESIRHYEKKGLLKTTQRAAQGYRLYDQAALERIYFIRHGRHLGLDLSSIGDLLNLADQPDQDCHLADEIARHHLQELEQRIAALESLAAELRQMTRQCSGVKAAECRIIQALFDHRPACAELHAPYRNKSAEIENI